jgi:PAS domain S-box-containing protein
MPFSPIPNAIQPKGTTQLELARAAAWSAASLVAVTLVKLAAFDYIGPATPFLLYFASIIVGAWFARWPGGLAVTAASALLGIYFFMPPFRSMHILDVATAVRLCAFIVEGVAITAITARLRRKQADTHAAAAQAKGVLSQFEGVLRGVADGITVQTPRGQLRYVNDVAAQLTGFGSAAEMLAAPPSEIIAKFELLSPDGRPFDIGQLPGRLALQGLPAPERLVQFRVRATGAVRFALVRANAVKLPAPDGGEELVAVNVFQDVTDKRREEEAREELREWLATTLRSIGDAVIATDANARVRFMNPVAERLTGVTSAEAEGQALQAVFRIVNEDTRQPVESPVDRVMREGRIVGLANHTVLIAKDGAETAIDDSAAPIRSTAGELIGTVLVFRDVSQHRAEEQRRAFVGKATVELASSLNYRQTLATVVRLAVPAIGDWCAIDMLDDGRLSRLAVHHIDQEKIDLVYEIQRRYPEDPASAGGAHAVTRTGEPVLLAEITDAMLTEAARDDEHLLLLRRLQLRSYLAVPLRVDQTVIGVLTFATAESGRRLGPADLALATLLADRAAQAVRHAQLYAAASEARSHAEQANRAKDEFLAMLGHELRNPLAPMLTALQLMKMRAPDELARERAIVERQVKHMVALVDDLLDVSRVTSGKIDLAREPVDMAETVVKALEVAAPLLEQKGHEVVVDAPPGALVAGDPTRLVRVLANLMVNAAKYTNPGGRIEVGVRRVADRCEAWVRDNGVGIAPELLPRVFDLFVQGARSLSREGGGLGLGLAIVRSVVELHGGRVLAESGGRDKGSEFRVVLPALETSAVPRRATPAPGQVVRSANLRVLVVDDNQDALESLTEALRLSGFEAYAAADAAAALAYAAQTRPNVALLDIGLPVIDGYELAGRLRALPGLERIKLIAVTGYGQPADKARAETAGFDEHMVKPVSLDQLHAVMERLMGTSPPPAEARGKASTPVSGNFAGGADSLPES